MPRLTPHFRTEEFDCRDGTPVPVYAHGQLLELAHGWLEPLRRKYGPVAIISGYRTPEHNRAVGGAPHSYHVYEARRRGVAADLVCRRGTPAAWFDFLNRREAHGLHQYPGHVHIDTRGGYARW